MTTGCACLLGGLHDTSGHCVARINATTATADFGAAEVTDPNTSATAGFPTLPIVGYSSDRAIQQTYSPESYSSENGYQGLAHAMRVLRAHVR